MHAFLDGDDVVVGGGAVGVCVCVVFVQRGRGVHPTQTAKARTSRAVVAPSTERVKSIKFSNAAAATVTAAATKIHTFKIRFLLLHTIQTKLILFAITRN